MGKYQTRSVVKNKKEEIKTNIKITKHIKKFHENGQLYIDVNYIDDKLDGKYMEYDINGQLLVEKKYSMGNILHETIYNGDMRKEISYYYYDGIFNVPLREKNYKNNLLNGPSIVYDKKGKFLTYIEYKDDKEHGVYKEYCNGKLSIDCNYKNGKKEGKYNFYWDNGNLSIDCNYADDKIEGEYKSYYYNGQPEKICNYVDDKIEGKYKSYYDNGQLYMECNYVNDEIEGICNIYLENGEIEEICNYVNGEKVE